MYLFYAPDIETTCLLPEDESAHCVRVLRKSEGDVVTITDGKGFFYDAHVVTPHPKRCEVVIDCRRQWIKPRSFSLHLAIAPTKNMDRMEWLAEKITELGIDTITPLLCRFSERKELKPDRIRKILVSAMKQSQQALLPQLNPMMPFNQFMKETLAGEKYIAHCNEGDKKTLPQCCVPGSSATLLIGPEGDFSDDEVTLALQNGFTLISLGDTRLRTETAALFACAAVHTINQGYSVNG